MRGLSSRAVARLSSLVALTVLRCAAAQSNDTCADKAPGSCPPPAWPARWQLNLSTCVQPGDLWQHEYWVPNATKPWGLVSLDWSVGRQEYFHGSPSNSTQEAYAVENGRRIKAASPQTRVFLYHNTEIALEWQESGRAAMYDPAKKHWFLQYTDCNGTKNGTIYDVYHTDPYE